MSDALDHQDKPTHDARTPPRRLIPRALAGSLVLSALLHLGPLFPVLLFVSLPPTDGFDFEWDDKFQNLHGVGVSSQGRWAELGDDWALSSTKPEEKPLEAPAEEAPKPEEKPQPPKKPKEPKKKPRPRAVPKDAVVQKEIAKKPEEPAPLAGAPRTGPSGIPDVEGFAPGNARMTALIRMDRLRTTPYADVISRMLRQQPDFRIILDGSPIDPVQDVDAFFAASADPRYIQETFLAMRHSLKGDELRGALTGRFAEDIPWSSFAGYDTRRLVPESSAYQDPRRILIAEPTLALVTRTEWIPKLVAPGDEEPDSPLSSGMLGGLAQIERAADDDGTLVVASFRGLRFGVPGYGVLPRFRTIRVRLARAEAPELTVDLQFGDDAEAAAFARNCPRMKSSLQTWQVRMLQLDTYIARLECTATEQYVTVNGSFTSAELLRILAIVEPFMPKPPALDELPAPPTPTEPAPADMGTSDLDSPPDADMGQPTADMPRANEDMR